MEDFNGISNEDFWRKASELVESLLKNPIKWNNDDLLAHLPDDVSLYKPLPRPAPFHLKSSSLDRSYRTYNPKVMTLIARSKKFDPMSDQNQLIKTFNGKNAFNIPISTFYNNKTLNFETYNFNKNDFKVSGHKAKILSNVREKTLKAPGCSDINVRLKEFIGKVQDKYSNLAKALEFKNETIPFESIIEYLRKSSVLLRLPTFSRDKQRAYNKSMSPVSRASSRHYENYSPRISEKINLLMVRAKQEILDPFKAGTVSKQHFYGILSMYEYTNFGMPSSLPSSRLDLNNTRHLKNLHSQVTEVKKIFKHYSDGRLLSKEGFSSLLKTICSEDQSEEILRYLLIGNKVNFGQFMIVIPLLLENYDSLMVKVKV
jgi:hypothetical protein